MKVHLIKRQTVEDFARANAQSRIALTDWLEKIKFANWESPEDINFTFKSADLLGKGSDRVIFNIGGNNYRLICKYLFGEKQVHLFVCWIGTHAEYDKLCSKKEQYTLNIF